MIGWLLDTNVISTIINPNGAPTVKAWAAGSALYGETEGVLGG